MTLDASGVNIQNVLDNTLSFGSVFFHDHTIQKQISA